MMNSYFRSIALAVAVFTAVGAHADTDLAWTQRVVNVRKQLQDSEKPVEESQKALYQLSLDFPLRMDWRLR